MSPIIESLGIILGIAFIIYFCMKSINIMIVAPVATFIVIVFNKMNLVSSLLGSGKNNYMGALGNYIVSFFAIFLLGSILAKLMEASGAALSIANFLIEKIGSSNPYRTLVAIFVISAVLTYGGISLFVAMFAIIPLSRALFKKVDIAWNLIQIPLWLGIATITMTMLPGTPSIQNVIPIKYLNTSLTAAPVPSLLGAAGCTAFGLIYMNYSLNKSLKKKETYATYAVDRKEKTEKKEYPGFLPSIFPLVSLIVIAMSGSLLGSSFLKENIIYIAVLAAILLSFFLFRTYLPDAALTLNDGANDSIGPIFSTSTAVAFGSVIVSAPGFQIFSNLILSIPGNRLISLTVLSAVMSFITGSSSGSLGIIMPNFAEYYLNSGLNPELIHRVAAIGTNILSIVPQSGAFLTFLSLTKLTPKNGFKESFITVTGSALIAEIIVILTGSLMYR